MTKILEIVPHFAFAKTFFSGRFKYFNDLGFEMHLACSPDEGVEEFKKDEGASIYTLRISRLPSLWNDFIAACKICYYIISNNIDCIVGHADKGKLLAAICGLITHRPVILYAHGTSFEGRTGLSRKCFILLDKFESCLSTKVICVSQYLVDLRLQNKIDKPGKAYLPNHGSCTGVDIIDKFNPEKINKRELEALCIKYRINTDDFVIGYCGRIVKDKGIEELVKAYSIINLNNTKVKLLLVGQKDIRDFIDKETTDLISKDENIIITGYIKENIEIYYSLMDICILPTHRDGFGMCMIEAAALGVPVMTTQITGSRDAICDGFNGEYISLNPQEIANKINNLINNKSLLETYSKNGIKWVKENFENKIVWDSIYACYKSVCKLSNIE